MKFSRRLSGLLISVALLATAAPIARADEFPTNDGSGLKLGTTAADRVGLHGKAVAQRSGAAQTALTDSTTGDTSAFGLSAFTGVSTLTFPIENASIANGDIVVAYIPGYKFKILKVTYVTNKPVTTGSKLSTITTKISGVAVTGGVLSLTSATMTPVGTLVAATAVSALNTGLSTDSITFTAFATTAFTEGNGSFLVEIQNMDVADGFARTAKLLNEIRATLVAQGDMKGS